MFDLKLNLIPSLPIPVDVQVSLNASENPQKHTFPLIYDALWCVFIISRLKCIKAVKFGLAGQSFCLFA